MFTNEAIRSSLKRNSYHELDVSVHFKSNWNLQILVFKKRGRLRVVPHFSSGIVERAKREGAWKSTHARKGVIIWPARNSYIRLVKDGPAEALARPLTQLMNRIFNEGTLPVDWRHAVVTPVHKAGSKSDPSNYRPISVLSLFSNILERAALHRMVYSYLQDHKILLR